MSLIEGYEDRAKGIMLGLACGDALGRPVEFSSPTRIEREHGRVTEMLGDGTHHQPPGTITDDTEMALCIAQSLIEQKQFDPVDIARRFVGWYESDPFDIGGMTRRSLVRIQNGESWDMAGEAEWESSPEGGNAGNGSVMRCAPLAIAYAEYPSALARTSMDSSRITHADPRCMYGCAILNLTLRAALADHDQPLESAMQLLADDVATTMHKSIGVVPDGTSTVLEGGVPEELNTAMNSIPNGVYSGSLLNSGYVVDTLQTALYDGLTADTVEEAIISAVNRGGDTDTIGAITGAVAGARLGTATLPERWLSVLDTQSELERLGTKLTAY